MWGDIAIAFLLGCITSFVITPYTIKFAKKIDKPINSKYNIYNMLSRVDERTGSITPQQPVIYKVLIPAKQSALNDDLNKIKIKTLHFGKVFLHNMKKNILLICRGGACSAQIKK